MKGRHARSLNGQGISAEMFDAAVVNGEELQFTCRYCIDMNVDENGNISNEQWHGMLSNRCLDMTLRYKDAYSIVARDGGRCKEVASWQAIMQRRMLAPRQKNGYVLLKRALSIELGLLRKRTLSSSGGFNRGSGSSSAGQIFKYLIVIDFESTCWEDAKFRTQEIIEFPAVLLNTWTGEVESEFHHYVQPQEQPTLSSFCTELTGITQSQVDDGIPINLCLRKFGHWLDRLHKEKGVVCQGTATDTRIAVNTTCVTWSDWDLGVCLQYECKRKQLVKPAQLNSWIDLRATYRKFYDRKPNGLNGALQDLGIEFQGREHSGVDDARNTAKLAHRMIRDGCQMKVTKTLKTHERSVSCNPTIPMFVARATRITPPRKAKKEASTNSVSNFSNGVVPSESQNQSPSKIPVRIKTPVKSRSVYKQNENTDRRDCSKETQSNGKSVNGVAQHPDSSGISQKRKQFTPVKNMYNSAAQSPRRKIQRKISPKKLTSVDIYIDQDTDLESQTSCTKSSETQIHKGLTVQDANVQASRHTHCKSDIKNIRETESNCFKKPNAALLKLSASSTFKTPSGIVTPKVNVGKINFRKGNFMTSTPLIGNSVSSGFNQSKTISPITSHSESRKETTVPDPKDSLSVMPGSFMNTGLKTPNQTPGYTNTWQHSGFSTSSSSMKVTPPLCKCGRRSRRRMVQSPGQNMGRFFFSCAIRKRVGSKEGCDFFKWETLGMGGQTTSSSGSVISKQFTPVVKGGSQHMSGISQKKSLGVRSHPPQKVYLR